MEDDYVEVRKSWWERNWKWLVPTGCVSILLIFVLFIAGIFFGVTSMMTNSDVYKGTMNEVQHNQLVIEKLGTPIEDDGMTSGSINTTNNDRGNCNLQIPIKGPKGQAIVFVVAEKKGVWKYSEMTVFIKATKEEINLLKK
ncbi:cytochrome c oxidase assembly factor Coa1 family protein [[Flexibacter] sp. ATCC 35103]|uniref:cytochrome c oxidase assembly factor Coa1 family protein n=1 Tax=[Flexibacter] sp. ATCC 35103 TaxID=1937528 RepID=UPI0009D22629|nr:cytochrome c oxidase assembly factor Coa1 family protein [[Flexibacter] sp. ATCC 35103]OMQ13684.1 hypothetical protein BXU01_04205 [[Flexibacter] sp. ATCC 35103]